MAMAKMAEKCFFDRKTLTFVLLLRQTAMSDDDSSIARELQKYAIISPEQSRVEFLFAWCSLTLAWDFILSIK